MHRRKKRRGANSKSSPCRGCGYNGWLGYSFHHIIPKKILQENLDKIYPDISIKKLNRLKRRTIQLCNKCHKRVHDTFGEGHKYWGPTTRRHLIKWLNIPKR